ncbi:MAG: enoyl-CoA hydratase/isomerase family protein [SAR202 cluster bacterium]|jgi:enoyl-CoA hydratase|nr:enoyl-CoA hydratase/isomerase family protein [SAR202 cluster bacterium]
MSDYKSILYEEKGPVRLITLNRPEALNAIGEGMEEELHHALDVAEADETARVIILTGAGRAFSAGYDMASVREAADTDPDSMIAKGSSAAQHINRWFYNDRKMLKNQTHIFEFSKPVIACVHGWCMGGGTWLSLTCDMTFCSEDAVFGQPEVRHISNSSFLWVLMAGYKNALRYSLTGDHIDAQEAFRIGLVNEVFPDRDAMMAEAFRLAERISMITPETVAANKYIATLGLEMMGLRNAITTNWLLSSIAHSSQRPDFNRREMMEAAMENGMRGFLGVRDGPFQPEPFGPRSEPRE